jgi:hypothetical protein
VYDKDVSHESDNRVSGYLLRFYDHRIPDGTFFAGAHRWRFISPETEDIDADKKARTAWNPTKWYRFRFEWSQTRGRWFKDGALQSTVNVPQPRPLLPLRLRRVGLPLRVRGPGQRHLPQRQGDR